MKAETDPLEAALEEGIYRLIRSAPTSSSGYNLTLAQCVRAFNGAFTEDEIKRVVRRLIADGRLGVRTRAGRTNAQPYVELELWELNGEEPVAVGRALTAAGAGGAAS